MNEQMLKDIKTLLLFEWDTWDENCGADIWKEDNNFTQIAKRNNVTKENIFEGIDEDLVECYEYLKYPIEMRFDD